MFVFVHAPDGPTIEAARIHAGGTACSYMQFGPRMIGYIEVSSHGERGILRSDQTISVLPNRHSAADASAHGKALGIQNAKTARDIFAAVFAQTQMDVFDPDL